MKLLVLGLDGATFDVLDPMLEGGKLPNLKKTIDNGIRGCLESTFSPVTGPAWTSLATGKNPGKTGVFDFFNRIDKSSFDLKPMGSADIKKARAYWDYLSEAQARVVILNYPRLYPPYHVNGFMVSGLGSSPEDDITYPPALKQSLVNICDGYRIHIPFSEPQYTNSPSLFVKETLELLETNKKSIEFLLETNPDIFTVVISATDFAQHFMWKYIDFAHPFYSAKEAGKYNPAFVEIWQEVDKILESILKIVTDDTNILIVSDHGFGPHKQSFYINSWLRNEGYLYWKNQLRASLQTFLYTRVRRLSPNVSGKLLKIGTRYSVPFIHQIDMKRTKAFANASSGAVGEICINTSPESPLKNLDDYRMTRDQIIEKIIYACNNLDIKVDIYSPDDVYTGQYVDLAPDILFVLNDFECVVYYGPSKKVYKQSPPSPNHSGTHKKNGIFVAYGPNIKQGCEIEGTKIYDIAPTILHMFGLPVPDDTDGRVLKEIFREGSEPHSRGVTFEKLQAEERGKIKEKIGSLKTKRKI